MNLKSTTHKDGDRVTCPHCNSVQVKSMANQPKKYPYPAPHGYDCKKCGNDFISVPFHIKPMWEGDATPPPQPTLPKKNKGCLVSIIKWALIALVALFALAYFLGDETPPKKDKPVKEVGTKKAPPQKQEFSKEAEEAAHAYIPPFVESEPSKSIANSHDQNDTLSIQTTIKDPEQ